MPSDKRIIVNVQVQEGAEGAAVAYAIRVALEKAGFVVTSCWEDYHDPFEDGGD